MSFSFFKLPSERHLHKSREYLEDAKVKRVEHQAAAEHHGALAQLYAERITRIETEISQALQARAPSSPPSLDADNESAQPKSDSVLIYSPRLSNA